MKVNALRNCCASGVDLQSGKVYDLIQKDAMYLISCGSAAQADKGARATKIKPAVHIDKSELIY